MASVALCRVDGVPERRFASDIVQARPRRCTCACRKGWIGGILSGIDREAEKESIATVWGRSRGSGSSTWRSVFCRLVWAVPCWPFPVPSGWAHGSVLTLLVHVDDVFVVGTKERCDRFAEELNEVAPAKNLGELGGTPPLREGC